MEIIESILGDRCLDIALEIGNPNAAERVEKTPNSDDQEGHKQRQCCFPTRHSRHVPIGAAVDLGR